MKKGIIYSLIGGWIVFISSCASLQTYDLNNDYAVSLHYPDADAQVAVVQEETEKSLLTGVPARNFYGGDLKRGGIWSASKGIYIEKGDTMVIESTVIGPDVLPAGNTDPSNIDRNHPFGATFPPVDLIKEPVMLKILARAQSKDTMRAILKVQVADIEGFRSNSKLPYQVIENSEEFKEYYFDLRGIYNQVTPQPHKVNGAMINNLQFLLNPGQEPGFAGFIYIKEIKVVPVPAAPTK